MLSAPREKPSLPSTRGPRSPWARHKAGSDSRMGAPAQSSGEKQELWARQRALAATGLSHGRGPTHAGAGTLPRDSASPAAPCTARPPRRQGGLAAHRDALHGGCFSSRQHHARIQPDLAAALGREPRRVVLAEPCGCWMRPLSSLWWQRHPQPGRSHAAKPEPVHHPAPGPQWREGDWGPWQKAGVKTVEESRGPGTTANSRGSHQPPNERWMEAPSRRRLGLTQTAYYNPTAWPVCLSFQLSVSLANQRRLFQESWKRRRNVSLGRGFLWKVWKNCGISKCVKVCLARSTFSFQSCCKDVNHEPVTLLAERKPIPLRRGAGSGSAVSLGRKRQTFILETSLGKSCRCCREPSSGRILPVSQGAPAKGILKQVSQRSPKAQQWHCQYSNTSQGVYGPLWVPSTIPFGCPPQPQPLGSISAFQG